MSQIWCNGRFIGPDRFLISPADRGLLHGLGLFETILAIDGRPVFVERHLRRLGGSCAAMGWDVDLDAAAAAMPALLAANGLATGRARIRLAVTGGGGTLDDLAAGGARMCWMSAAAAPEAVEAVAVNIAPFRRNERSPITGMKSASYAENLVALDHARRLGFAETLFLNTTGDLCEAATANVFLVIGDQLRTPALESGCLPGIARELVIEIAALLGIGCRETRLTEDDLRTADGIFLTSALRGVAGVSLCEDRTLPPCAVTGTLRRAWDEAVRSDARK